MAHERKRVLVGRVVSDKMDKTVMVSVERTRRHPLYGKVVRQSRKYMAHDEHNSASTGDTVQITEARPFSKKKRWLMTKIVERSLV